MPKRSRACITRHFTTGKTVRWSRGNPGCRNLPARRCPPLKAKSSQILWHRQARPPITRGVFGLLGVYPWLRLPRFIHPDLNTLFLELFDADVYAHIRRAQGL